MRRVIACSITAFAFVVLPGCIERSAAPVVSDDAADVSGDFDVLAQSDADAAPGDTGADTSVVPDIVFVDAFDASVADAPADAPGPADLGDVADLPGPDIADVGDSEDGSDACTPQCGDRVCGPDPACGESCGSCDEGEGDCAAFCNEDGQCEFPGTETVCGATSCLDDGVTMLGPLCDGAGGCGSEAVERPCEPYECSQGHCLTSCAGDSDCWDGYHCADSVCEPSAPDATIEGAPICGMAPLTVQFSLAQTGGPCTSVTWDFGNRTRGTGLETTATYNIAGDFDITATLSGPGGERTVTAPALVHADGFVWLNPLPTGDDLQDIWCADEEHVYAITAAGELLENTGDGFVLVDPGVHASEVDEHFHHPAVWGDEFGNVFYVDSTGVRYRIDGVWHYELNPLETPLHDVWGGSATNVYVVGESGAVLHFDGQSWTQQDGFPNENYRSVFGVDGTLFVGGDNGLLVRVVDPGTPVVVASGEIHYALVDLWASSPEDLYIVAGGSLHRFDGGLCCWRSPGLGWY